MRTIRKTHEHGQCCETTQACDSLLINCTETEAQSACSTRSSTPTGRRPSLLVDININRSRLHGHVWSLSKTKEGCQEVQKALKEAASDHDRFSLACELETHVLEAIKCPHANYVLQTCIGRLPPEFVQFIIDEIRSEGPGSVVKIARHRSGCRILQRLFEHCPSEQVQALAEELLENIEALASHIFGNYVMQSLLQHGTSEQISRLIYGLAEHAATVGQHYGSAVMNEAFEHGSTEAQVDLANAILRQPDLLTSIRTSRNGSAVIRRSLSLADEHVRNAALPVLVKEKDVMLNTRYGRALYKSLQTTYLTQEQDDQTTYLTQDQDDVWYVYPTYVQGPSA